MNGWIAAARRPVRDFVPLLGLVLTRRARRDHHPCPVRCGDDASVYATADFWCCHRCEIRGDSVDYVAYALHGRRVSALEPEQLRTVREWFGAPSVVAPAPQAPRPAPQAPDVDGFWQQCTPVPSDDPFVRARRLAPCPSDLARFTPPTLGAPFWPAGRSRTWRLVTRGWTAEGQAVNVHGRAVVPPPTFEGKPGPKTLWARSYCECPTRCLDACPTRRDMPAARLLFWNRVRPEHAELTLIAEGLTDWLSLSLMVGERPVAVYGATSGGFPALSDVGVRTDVIVCVDEDAKGDSYFAQVLDALASLRIYRARPSRILPRLSSLAAK